jgi:UDP-N-acetylmuramoyl-tripeptide--D-alanyl-D-alanine ligase
MITTEEIIQATGGELLSHYSGFFSGVSIDSRTISEDELFFALKGERFDGHDFLEDALMKGTGAVVDSKRPKIPEGKAVIYVKDTLDALQDLAHFLRKRREVPVIAITGSNGKTTTKEMAYAILSQRFKVLKNEGNLNNHIGLPLTLTRITHDDEVVVLEMGMNAMGEIKRLCEIAAPTHGVITNISSAHVGELGGLENIREAKLEILDGLSVTVLNADDVFLMEGFASAVKRGREYGRLITFSVHRDSGVRAEEITEDGRGSSFTLRVEDGDNAVITMNVHGLFNVYNALAASAVCLSLGITTDEIKAALERYRAFPMRFEIFRVNNITVINDAYNANPSSVEESLKELVRMRSDGRIVAVLGDMYELGEFSEGLHRSIGEMIPGLGINVFVAVGEMMAITAEESRKAKGLKSGGNAPLEVYDFRSSEEVAQNITDIVRDGDTVLVKGSRAMGMEKIVEKIRS